jgi:serine/threonine protein kinase/preprotein translocase subunit SecG
VDRYFVLGSLGFFVSVPPRYAYANELLATGTTLNLGEAAITQSCSGNLTGDRDALEHGLILAGCTSAGRVVVVGVLVDVSASRSRSSHSTSRVIVVLKPLVLLSQSTSGVSGLTVGGGSTGFFASPGAPAASEPSTSPSGTSEILAIIITVSVVFLIVAAILAFALGRRQRHTSSAIISDGVELDTGASTDETDSSEGDSFSGSEEIPGLNIGKVGMLKVNLGKRKGMVHGPVEALLSDDVSIADELKEWSVQYFDFVRQRELARGNFGQVYTGSFRGSQCVCKEVINTEDAGSKEECSAMIAEALLLSKVKPHAAVATFYGVCLDPKFPACIVLEFVAGGSLLDYVSNHELAEADVLSIGRDLASALGHLQATNILHCDGKHVFSFGSLRLYLPSVLTRKPLVAARNCLVIPRKQPIRIKLCDFGLSHAIKPQQISFPVGDAKLPIRWTALEVFRDGLFHRNSDVWSWAIVLGECLSSGQLPYSNIPTNAGVMDFLCDGGRADIPVPESWSSSAALKDLVNQCWAEDPKLRPHLLDDITSQCVKLLDRSLAAPSAELVGLAFSPDAEHVGDTAPQFPSFLSERPVEIYGLVSQNWSHPGSDSPSAGGYEHQLRVKHEGFGEYEHMQAGWPATTENVSPESSRSSEDSESATSDPSKISYSGGYLYASDSHTSDSTLSSFLSSSSADGEISTVDS